MLRCEKCNKEFAAEESLNQHNKSKHQELYEEPKSKLTEKQKEKNKKLVDIYCYYRINHLGNICNCI